MLQGKERDIGKPSQRACPISVLSLLFCVLILVRVELVHRQTISVEDQFHSQQDWKSIVEHSEDSGGKQTRHRRDVLISHLTMAEVTAEIDKKLRAFRATLCSPKENNCVRGPRGPRGPPGKTGASGAPGRRGRRGKTGAMGPTVQGGGIREPKVHVLPSNLTVDEHQNALFYCTATGNPTPEVTWSRAEDSGSKPLESNNGALQIHNAGLSDIGKYTCSAKNVIGTLKESVKLFVQVPPMRRGRYFPTKEVFQTLDTTMTCDVIGFPDPVVTWEHNSLFSNRHVIQGKTLVIKHTHTSDEGAYICEGRSAFGSVFQAIHLKVLAIEPPKLEAVPRATVPVTHIGESVNITCSASGRPTPEVTWTKDGKTAHDVTVTKKTTSQIVISEVVIKNFQPHHNGDYTCMFHNEKNQTVEASTRVVLANCGHPSSVQNGHVIGSRYWSGDAVFYSCNQGYTLTGHSTRVCMESGQWSEEEPTCRRTCQDPGSPIDGFRVGSRFWEGEHVSYRCDDGHEVKGSVRRTCQKDGQWSGITPSCSELANCGHPGSVQNGHVIGSRYWSGDVIFFSCNQGYTLTDLSTRVCMASGQWSEKEPTCRRTCQDPGSPINGFRVGSRFWEGEHVTYGCNDGHEMKGSVRRTCQKDGQWSGITPSCSGSVSCGHPGLVTNGHVTGSNYWPGYHVVFHCNRDYTLVGSETRVCMAWGKWSGEQPTCRRTCQVPEAPSDGYRVGSRFWEGEDVSYHCDFGYVPLISMRGSCQSDGQWSGITPICIHVSHALPSECRQYTALDNIDRNHQLSGGGDKFDDYLPKGWYRFQGGAGTMMADTCTSKHSCTTKVPGWLSGGPYPTAAEGVVTRKVCWHASSCCPKSSTVRVRNCGSFFVYELGPSPSDGYYRYCGQW